MYDKEPRVMRKELMDKHSFLIFFFVLNFVLSCDIPESGAIDYTNKANRSLMSIDLTYVDIPFEGLGLADYRGKLLIIGVNEIANFDPNTSSITKHSFPGEVNPWLSADGGKSTFSPNSDSSATPSICSIEKALSFQDRLFLIGPCEHTSQFWSLAIEDSAIKSYVVEFTYSTFPHSNAYDRVYAPVDLIQSGNAISMLSNTKNGPEVLSVSLSGPTFKPVWQGNETDGNVIASDFTDNIGWFATANGYLFKTINNGFTWSNDNRLPPCFEKGIDQMPILGSKAGYIFCTSGAIYRTEDGGVSWNEWESQYPGRASKVIPVTDKLVILTVSGSVLVLNKKGELLHSFSSEKGDPFIDVLVLKDSLFALSYNKLGYLSLKDRK